jgi:hypothetical protein
MLNICNDPLISFCSLAAVGGCTVVSLYSIVRQRTLIMRKLFLVENG